MEETTTINNNNNTQETKSDSIDDEIKKMSRECIQCDGPDCNTSNPQQRCSRCHTAYYCGKECQIKHWKKEHKQYCRPIETMKQLIEDDENSMNDFASQVQDASFIINDDTWTSKAVNTECCICFTDPIINYPVVLKDCKHAFCRSCLIQWQQQQQQSFLQQQLFQQQQEEEDSSTTKYHLQCPICRQHTDDIIENMITIARVQATRASQPNCKEEDKKQYLEQSLLNLNQALEHVSENPKLRIFYFKAEVLIKLHQGQEAIECIETMLKINEERVKQHERKQHLMEQILTAQLQGNINLVQTLSDQLSEIEETSNLEDCFPKKDLKSYVACKILQANAYQSIQDWPNAIKIYLDMTQLIESPDQVEAIQMREIFMGLAKCCYLVKHYTKSIYATDAALEMNRHFPQVHKYKILSQAALSDYKGAVHTANQAVLYETPWDESNQQSNLNLYYEMKTKLEEWQQQKHGEQKNDYTS